MSDPKLPDLPKPIPMQNANVYRPPLQTDVKVTGSYLLSAVDDSNEHWSIPEWVTFAVVRTMCLVILTGGVWLLSQQNVDRDLRIMVTMLAPAAGFKLIESAAMANKRGSHSNGNGGKK